MFFFQFFDIVSFVSISFDIDFGLVNLSQNHLHNIFTSCSSDILKITWTV